MFNCCYKSPKNDSIIPSDTDIDTSDKEIDKLVDSTIYKLLCHKIRNYIELSEPEIEAIFELSYDNKIKIIKLFYECIKHILSYSFDT